MEQQLTFDHMSFTLRREPGLEVSLRLDKFGPSGFTGAVCIYRYFPDAGSAKGHTAVVTVHLTPAQTAELFPEYAGQIATAEAEQNVA